MARRGQRRRAAGELEAEVLAALWAADRRMTAAEVQESLGSGLAYTTVLTILARLHEKGLVERGSVGRGYSFRPVLAEAELTAQAMQELLDRGGDHAAALEQFVGRLSAEDEVVLRSLIGGD